MYLKRTFEQSYCMIYDRKLQRYRSNDMVRAAKCFHKLSFIFGLFKQTFTIFYNNIM